MLHAGSEVSSHRHRTAIEQDDASACMAPPAHAVGIRSTGNPEIAPQALHGPQLATEESVGCASAAPSRSSSCPVHVAKSAPGVKHEDCTARDAASTSVRATRMSGNGESGRTHSAMVHVPRVSEAASIHFVAVPRTATVGGPASITPRWKATMRVLFPGFASPPVIASRREPASTLEPYPPQASSSRDALGDNGWGLSSASTNAVAVAPMMSVGSAPGHDSRICQPNTTKPDLMTHIIGEYIIQESSEAFPGDYKSPLVGPVSQILSLEMEDNLDTDVVAENVGMRASSPAREEPPQSESPPLSPARTTAMETETRPLELTGASGNKNLRMSAVKEVADYVRNIPGCEASAEKFICHEIDGMALFLLTMDDIVKIMNIKLGPAIKIWDKINTLREER
ncbi:hypothetical protein HPB48_014705 [Haemaphysalis longicornis]|uniref:SAM domain-containing protein n=1 Tax=Haemaphysalis longicornis TaxID=44386 RepID=A0A9J6GCA8_HAELO|nr:hypothetical protein HPB48_014705 [Haemaphysalis longicornis]